MVKGFPSLTAALAAALVLLVWAPTAAALTFMQTSGSPLLLTSGAPGGQSSAGLVEGDLNGDGKLDLAASWAGTGPEGAGSYVSILLGNGAGGFMLAAGSPTLITGGGAATAGALAVGNFNADHRPDLSVVSSKGSASTPGEVSILLGDGDGTFNSAGTPLPVGRDPSSIAVGDFNGDQSADLAITNLGSGTVSLLLGDGTGGFSAAPSSPITDVGGCPEAVTTGDFNGDRRVDLAVGNNGCSGSGGYYGQGDSGALYILLGNGSGAFSPTSTSPLTVSDTVTSIVSADFNGDGKADLAMGPGAGSSVPVLLGDGKGGFGSATGATTGISTPNAVAIGDFDGDGVTDLAIAGDTQSPHYPTNGVVQVMPGNGHGGFVPVPDSPFSVGEQPNTSPSQVVVGDFNGDHRPDIAVLSLGCQCQAPDGGPGVTVLLNEPGNSSAPTAVLNASPNPALTDNPVTLEAFSSYGGSANDPIVDYKWDLGTGTFSLDTGQSSEAFKTFSTVGQYQVRVRVTNETGATDTATLQVDVRPAPPPGAVGVVIDRGAYATNTTAIKLHLVWPGFATQALISNDSAFDAAGDTQTVSLVPTLERTLPSASSSRTPQRFYVRFPDSSTEDETFSDGIVLDTTVPAVQRARLVANGKAADARRRTFRVRIHATEKVSGISAVQLSTGRSRGSKMATIILAKRTHRGIGKLARILTVRMTKAPARVRVRSAAGTWSSWKRVG